MLRGFVIASLLLTSCSLSLPAQTSSRHSARYTISIETRPALRARVAAELPAGTTRLTMGTGAIDHLPEGWSTFVDSLVLKDTQGRIVRSEKSMDSTSTPVWTLRSTQPGPLTMHYSINLRFAQEKWPPGNEQAGLWADSALFVVTKALFIVPDGEGPWNVTFRLPARWKVSAPWKSDSTAPANFMVPNRSSLLYNTVVLGRHAEYRFTSGGFDVTLALLGPAGSGVQVVRETFEPVLKEYTRIFSATPAATYLMTLFYGDDEDGEGFESSGAFRTKVPLERDTRLLWGNHLAHELLHMWNGHQLHGADKATSEWLQEGFTEYLSNRALLRTGMISRENFFRKMEYNISLYSYFRLSGLFDTVSVRQAGARKWRHRFGVYNGGWAVAFTLDQLLREHSDDQKSLDDFMGGLYTRRATRNEPWSWEDLIATASEVAGTDMGDFFTRYVAGLEALPLDHALTRLGLRLMGQSYAAEMYVGTNPSADPSDHARGEAYLSVAASQR
jgi:predicted metalloprotease with PDZ domain